MEECQWQFYCPHKAKIGQLHMVNQKVQMVETSNAPPMQNIHKKATRKLMHTNISKFCVQDNWRYYRC